jgi:hypothetical protein
MVYIVIITTIHAPNTLPIMIYKYIYNVYTNVYHFQTFNRIGDVMISVPVSSAVDHGFEPMKLAFVASPESTQEKGQRLVATESR